MELTAAQFETFTEVADEVAGDVRADYSGRGMFGRTCVAVTFGGTDTPGFVAGLFFRLTLADEDLATDLVVERLTDDSMGRGTVVYWPDVTAAIEAGVAGR